MQRTAGKSSKERTKIEVKKRRREDKKNYCKDKFPEYKMTIPCLHIMISEHHNEREEVVLKYLEW